MNRDGGGLDHLPMASGSNVFPQAGRLHKKFDINLPSSFAAEDVLKVLTTTTDDKSLVTL